MKTILKNYRSGCDKLNKIAIPFPEGSSSKDFRLKSYWQGPTGFLAVKNAKD